MAVVGELHVTFICTGNICRSPMAEKIFAAQLERAGLADRVRVSSAGTTAWHAGSDADPRTTALLLRHGYPVGHVAAMVGADHLDADLLVALDTSHERDLMRLGVPAARRRLLRSFDPAAEDRDVPDPYYGDDSDFELVREQVEAAVPGLLDWVREQLAVREEGTGMPETSGRA
ncbi:low molecular weight protein-tyrosine-phosphatase [Nocardia transvalensis]|uniref:low molecular weight protein-tyrosine-phosphatase n=1 Tax=Nocardia transvalensis TaxID=37333 RepID=UPI0018942177|nr:low molecular weight protein-tyrosine-phosphatase [Nocardia transvalensis]MBF6330333.1 low molecular weight phosphotyrosine protein phosphatase [Nocardia transvalensis]